MGYGGWDLWRDGLPQSGDVGVSIFGNGVRVGEGGVGMKSIQPWQAPAPIAAAVSSIPLPPPAPMLAPLPVDGGNGLNGGGNGGGCHGGNGGAISIFGNRVNAEDGTHGVGVQSTQPYQTPMPTAAMPSQALAVPVPTPQGVIVAPVVAHPTTGMPVVQHPTTGALMPVQAAVALAQQAGISVPPQVALVAAQAQAAVQSAAAPLLNAAKQQGLLSSLSSLISGKPAPSPALRYVGPVKPIPQLTQKMVYRGQKQAPSAPVTFPSSMSGFGANLTGGDPTYSTTNWVLYYEVPSSTPGKLTSDIANVSHYTMNWFDAYVLINSVAQENGAPPPVAVPGGGWTTYVGGNRWDMLPAPPSLAPAAPASAGRLASRFAAASYRGFGSPDGLGSLRGFG